MKTKKNKEFNQAFIISFIYLGIGTYDLFSGGELSKIIDELYDNLDLYLIFPSHIFGSITYWILSGFYDTKFWLVVGQTLGLFFFSIIGYIVIKVSNTIKKRLFGSIKIE